MDKSEIMVYLKSFFSGICSCAFLFLSAQKGDLPNEDFRYADSIAIHYNGEELSDLSELTLKLTGELKTDKQKFRAIYSWVCQNIEIDHQNYLLNKRKREKYVGDSLALSTWNNQIQIKVLHRLFTQKKTVCTGYAYLVREMAALAGITCLIVDGYGRTASSNVHQLGIPNHSWNAVFLDSAWYLCDPTWSSGMVYAIGAAGIHKFDYNEGFFLTKPEFFLKTHFPLDTNLAFTNKVNREDFLSAPLIYHHAYKLGLNPETPELMEVSALKNQNLTFEYELLGAFDIEGLHFEVNTGFKSWIIDPEISFSDSGKLYLSILPEKLGVYDLQLKLGEEYLATYILRVRKASS